MSPTPYPIPYQSSFAMEPEARLKEEWGGVSRNGVEWPIGMGCHSDAGVRIRNGVGWGEMGKSTKKYMKA